MIPSIFYSYNLIDQLTLFHPDLERNQRYHYSARIQLQTGGNYGYTFRVMPKHEMLLDSENLNLVKWIEK